MTQESTNHHRHAVPVAVPVPWSSPEEHAQVGDAFTKTGATTSNGSSYPVSSRGARVGRRQLAAIRDSLSERDWAVLGSVAAHRYLTTRQIQAFHFADHTSDVSAARVCRRVLERLRRDRLLGTLNRRVGGVRAGSASYVWHVDVVGDRLLREAAGIRARRRAFEPSLHFLKHTLAVADVHLSLLHAVRTKTIDRVRVETEPACHRRYLGPGGATLTVKPDLFAVTSSGEYEDVWFIEIDLGTESLPRLIAKCREYEHYRRSGTEQRMQQVFPQVVWLIGAERRRAGLRAAVVSDPMLRDDVFKIVAADGLAEIVAGERL